MKIKSTNIITILLVGITIALSTGCIAQNREGEHSVGKENVTPEITFSDGITVEPSVLKTLSPCIKLCLRFNELLAVGSRVVK